MAYSLEKDQWCLSVSRPAMPWLSYSLPRRFALCRGFKYESRPDPPKVQSRVIREYLNSKTPSSGHFSNYIPSTLLEELLLDDLIRRQALEEKSRRRNRMQVFWFEDSLLMAHPVGNCGTRVGLSRILPWYDMTASSVDDSSSRNDWKQAPCWQTIPKDFLEFDCGRSQLRIILHGIISTFIFFTLASNFSSTQNQSMTGF